MRALALTLAVSGVVATACGGSSGEPRTAPPVSSSPTSVVSPTPAAGEVPAEAKAPTSAGAEAFAKFFYAQTSRAFAMKDPELVRVISAPGCTGCERFIASITRLRDKNERMENYDVAILFAVAPAIKGDIARVDVSWKSLGQVIRYDAAGKVINREGPFSRVDDQLELVRGADGWLLREVKSLRFQK